MQYGKKKRPQFNKVDIEEKNKTKEKKRKRKTPTKKNHSRRQIDGNTMYYYVKKKYHSYKVPIASKF